MTEAVIKHLEMIQGVISRMSSHGVAVKSWAVTVVAAVMALASGDNVPLFCIIAVLAVCLFCYLDTFFLQQERLFRCLFDAVRRGERNDDAFTMDVSPFRSEAGHELTSVLASSRSLWAVYAVLVAGPFFRLLVSVFPDC